MNNRCSLAKEEKKEDVDFKVKELEEEELNWRSCSFRKRTHPEPLML